MILAKCTSCRCMQAKVTTCKFAQSEATSGFKCRLLLRDRHGDGAAQGTASGWL